MFPIRDENASHRFPFVVVALIVVNTLVFLNEIQLGPALEHFVFEYAILPIEITRGLNLPKSEAIPPYLTLVTSMFLHGSWGHLLGNMWFLWIFGDNIEDRLGKRRFLFFYLFTGIVAGLVHVGLNPDSAIPTVGASGAISGVLGGYIVLFPHVRIRTLFFIIIIIKIIRVPAILFLGVWFVTQYMGLTHSGEAGSGVAFGAHIGGFVAGAAMIVLMRGWRVRPLTLRS